MPIETTLVDGFIHTRLSGDIDDDMVAGHLDFLLSLRDETANIFEFHDHSDSSVVNLSADKIQGIAEKAKVLNDAFQHNVLAVFAPNDYVLGMARMFEAFFEISEINIDARFFGNREDAIRFLKDKINELGHQRR